MEEISRANKILARQVIEDNDVYSAPVDSSESIISDDETGVTRHAVVSLPHLREVEALLEDFIIHSFPLYKVSLIGENVPQSPPFTGVAASDRLNAEAMAIPPMQAHTYSDRVRQGQYLAIISASDREMKKALSILETSGILDWRVYDQNQIFK